MVFLKKVLQHRLAGRTGLVPRLHTQLSSSRGRGEKPGQTRLARVVDPRDSTLPRHHPLSSGILGGSQHCKELAKRSIKRQPCRLLHHPLALQHPARHSRRMGHGRICCTLVLPHHRSPRMLAAVTTLMPAATPTAPQRAVAHHRLAEVAVTRMRRRGWHRQDGPDGLLVIAERPHIEVQEGLQSRSRASQSMSMTTTIILEVSARNHL